MLIWNLRLHPFFAPSDSENLAIEDKQLSTEDTIKFMGEDDDKETIDLEDKKSEKKVDEKKDEEIEEEPTEESKEEETDELKEIEEELEEPDDEKLELVTPARRKDILAKYPTLFKDFPYLERAYYREQKYTEILPTIEDAETAVEKANALDKFESSLVKGDTTIILKGLKELDSEAFNRVVENYLPNLEAVDQNAFFHVIGGLMNRTISGMMREARAQKNEALEIAAQLLNQYVFGRSDFKEIEPLTTKKETTEDESLKAREREFVQRQFDTASNDLSTRFDNLLKATIEANMDPKKSMTDYVRKNAIKDALDDLKSKMKIDKRFAALNDRLWEAAFRSNFSKSDLDRILSAHRTQAKMLLPDIIKKARNEALRGMGKRVKEDSEEESNRGKGHAPVGRSATSSNRGNAKEEAGKIPAGMKTLDYLMKD